MGINSLDTDLADNATVWNRPKRFEGSEEERRANRASHRWETWQYSEDGIEEYCDECCAKPWHAAADWPCGVKVPREEVHYTKEGTYTCDESPPPPS